MVASCNNCMHAEESLGTMLEKSAHMEYVCKTVGASFKAVGDNFNKLQNHRARFAAVGPVWKPSGPL